MPQQTRSRQVYERLLDAGERLIAERGYEGARVEDITRAAGCAVGTLYHRFGDKDVFFQALQARFCERGRAVSDALFSANRIRGLNARQIVQLFVEVAVTGVRDDAGFLRAMALRLGHAPEVDGPMQGLVGSMTKKLAGALRGRAHEIQHPHPMRAIASATQFMMGTLLNILLNNPGPLELEDPNLPRELTRMFTAYLGVPP